VNFWIRANAKAGRGFGFERAMAHIASSNTMMTDLAMETFHATLGPCFQPKSDMYILDRGSLSSWEYSMQTGVSCQGMPHLARDGAGLKHQPRANQKIEERASGKSNVLDQIMPSLFHCVRSQRAKA
jgi:hypothetical protein